MDTLPMNYVIIIYFFHQIRRCILYKQTEGISK